MYFKHHKPGWQGENVKDIILTGGSRLVEHAHDLLLTSKAHKRLKDTICLWSALAERKEQPTHLSKLQLCYQEVKYLGFILTKEQRSIDPELVQAVVEIPCRQRKQLAGFFRHMRILQLLNPRAGELQNH